MSREIKTKEDAREWYDDAMKMKGNSCINESQRCPIGSTGCKT